MPGTWPIHASEGHQSTEVGRKAMLTSRSVVCETHGCRGSLKGPTLEAVLGCWGCSNNCTNLASRFWNHAHLQGAPPSGHKAGGTSEQRPGACPGCDITARAVSLVTSQAWAVSLVTSDLASAVAWTEVSQVRGAGRGVDRGVSGLWRGQRCLSLWHQSWCG